MNTETFKQKTGFDKVLAWLGLSSIYVSGIYVETKYGNLFFSYLLMLAIYPLCVIRSKSFGLRKSYIGFLFCFLVFSSLSYLVTSGIYGIDPTRLVVSFLKFALLIFFIVFFTVIYNVSGRTVSLLFKSYLQVSVLFAGIGVVQELAFLVLKIDILSSLTKGAKDYGDYLGVAGLSVEPAFYACSLLPAGAYYISTFIRTFRFGVSGLIVISALILSTSSLGYLGLLLAGALTIVLGIKLRHAWMVIFMLPLLGVGTYKISQLDFFQMRMNDTISVLSGAELTMSTGMNISTYSLAVNMSMSGKAVKDGHGFGAGFGNYSNVFDHYITDYEMPTYRDDLPGRGSGTSLFARLTAEMGIAAWLIFTMFMYWCWCGIRKSSSPAIGIAYAATFAIVLLRMGEYYANGVVLVFLMMYWLQAERLRQKMPVNSSVRVSKFREVSE